MKTLVFTAIIDIREGNPFIWIELGRAQQIKSPWKKPMPVLIRINGEPKAWWKINMMPVGDGSFYLYLHGEVRKASQTKVGDKVKVEIKFDSDYKNGPQHPMPEWFKTRLEKNSKAQKSWENLTPSRQKEILRYFHQLKSEDAKKRNLEKALQVLSGEEGRFMARDWKDGK